MTTAAETLTIPKQREYVASRDYRRAMANRALGYFADGVVVTEGIGGHGGLVVSWHADGQLVFRRWQVRGGQSFYATWSDRYPGGGTSMTALSQLVRWIQGRPVLPLSTWRYWCGDGNKLARDQGDELLRVLVAAGYPETAACVLCGRTLDGLDWWCLPGCSGPCCPPTAGCEQQVSRDGRAV